MYSTGDILRIDNRTRLKKNSTDSIIRIFVENSNAVYVMNPDFPMKSFKTAAYAPANCLYEKGTWLDVLFIEQ